MQHGLIRALPDRGRNFRSQSSFVNPGMTENDKPLRVCDACHRLLDRAPSIAVGLKTFYEDDVVDPNEMYI